MRYYFSFTNTMHHFFIDKIPLDELKAGQFVFGKERGAMLNGNIPTKVTVYNKEKPYLLTNTHPIVGEEHLDGTVKEKWKAFYGLMIEKDAAGAIIWQRGGESYLRKIKDYLKSGHEVVFDGQLQKLEWYKWLDDEPTPASKKKLLKAGAGFPPHPPPAPRYGMEQGAYGRERDLPVDVDEPRLHRVEMEALIDEPDDMDAAMPEVGLGRYQRAARAGYRYGDGPEEQQPAAYQVVRADRDDDARDD